METKTNRHSEKTSSQKKYEMKPFDEPHTESQQQVDFSMMFAFAFMALMMMIMIFRLCA